MKTPIKKKSRVAPCSAEELLAMQLRMFGIKFEREFVFHPTRKWRADFYIVGYRLLVEVEGIRYSGGKTRHQTGRGYEEDCIKYNSASVLGYSVLRFTQDLVNGKGKGSTKQIQPPAIQTILQFIRGTRNV